MTSRSPKSKAAASQVQTWHLTDYLRIIYKRRWTAALAFLGVFLVGAFSTLKETPIYESTTQLLIEQEARSANSLNTVLDNQNYWFEDDFYLTQYRLIQSRAMAWQAIEALGIAPKTDHAAASGPVTPQKSWLGQTVAWATELVSGTKRAAPPAADETTAQSEAIDRFLHGLRVVPVRSTRLVDINYRSPDPVFAARAANAIAQQYMEGNQRSRFLVAQDANDWLGKAMEEQRIKLEESEAALQEYKASHDAVTVDDTQNIVVQKLTELNAAVTRAKTARVDKEILYNRLSQLQSDPSAIESFPAVMGNEFVQRLKSQIVELRQRKTDLGSTYGEKMPQMVALQNQIVAAEQKLQAEISKIVKSVQDDFEAAKATEAQLVSALEVQKSEALRNNQKGLQYAALEREAAGNRQLYSNLMDRVKETDVTSKYKSSNVRIIDAAEVPRYPVLPQTARDLMMAFIGGLLLALGLVFGFEYMDSAIKTPDEIKAHLGLPFLGLVPIIPGKDRKAGEDQTPLIGNTNVPANFSEAMRAIRTSVIFSSAEAGARTVVVTSTAPSEGKTLVSCNLAAALAQAGQKVLIVDGDMRRPRVHEVFGCLQEPGLSNVLVGTSRLRAAVLPSSIPQLEVLTAGHLPPNPAELLGSNRYLELLAELGTSYDWIIIDAPPVMAVTDAAVAANRATGVVFVVGAEMTPHRNAKAAIEQLAAAKARFIGVVLNRVNLHRHSYYYSPYYRKDYQRVYERAN